MSCIWGKSSSTWKRSLHRAQHNTRNWWIRQYFLSYAKHFPKTFQKDDIVKKDLLSNHSHRQSRMRKLQRQDKFYFSNNDRYDWCFQIIQLYGFHRSIATTLIPLINGKWIFLYVLGTSSWWINHSNKLLRWEIDRTLGEKTHTKQTNQNIQYKIMCT